MHRRTVLGLGAAVAVLPSAWAHHGWSSFDIEHPIYLEGTVRKVLWRNPHAELELEVPADLKLPADLARRALPAQTAPVDGAKLLAAAALPARREPVWEIELAPLTRMAAWKVVEPKVGERVSVLGFVLADGKGPAVLRAEYLFAGGSAYGLRSAPV